VLLKDTHADAVSHAVITRYNFYGHCIFFRGYRISCKRYM
jgi:hypothetical protein